MHPLVSLHKTLLLIRRVRYTPVCGLVFLLACAPVTDELSPLPNISSELDPRQTALTLTVCPAAGEGCDEVGGDGLQRAVDRAIDGALIKLRPGTYSRATPTEYSVEHKGKRYRRKAMVYVADKAIQIEGVAGVNLDGAISAPMAGIVADKRAKVSIRRLRLDGFRADDASCVVSETQACSRGTALIAMGNAEVEVSGSAFIDSASHVIAQESATLRLRGVTLSGAKTGRGAEASGQSLLSMRNSLVLGSAHEGIALFEQSKSEIVNNYFQDNHFISIHLVSCASDGVANAPVALIKNNIIARTRDVLSGQVTTGFAIGAFCINQVDKLANQDISKNIAFQNEGDRAGCSTGPTVDDWKGEYCGAGVAHINPHLRDISVADAHLLPTSPAVDQGDAVIRFGDPPMFDVDGSSVDIGAYGGPGACELDFRLPGCAQ